MATLVHAGYIEEVNLTPAIIAELERRVNICRHHPEIDNRTLATS